MSTELFTFILADYSGWIEGLEELDKYHGLAELNNCTVEIDTYLDAIIYTGTRSNLLDLGRAAHYLHSNGRPFTESAFLECLMPAIKQATASVNLTKKESLLLLRILESYEGVDDFKDYDVEKAISQIWNKVFNSGLDSGFGETK